MESARCKAFLKSVDTGSFKAAAEALGYTPSGVSQLVQALEKELNLKLLYRSKRGVSVTPEGAAFVPIIRSFLDREQDIYHLAEEFQGISKGNLTIAAYPSIAITWLPEIVREFQHDYPGVHVDIKEGIRSEIFEYLDQHAVDMGFLAYSKPMNYEWIPLAEERMLAALPEDHPMANREAYPIEACENDDFIMTSWGQDPDIQNIFDRFNVHPKVKYTTYDTPVTLAMVRMGLGISIVNELSAQYWSEHLVKLPLDPPQKITFGIAYTSLDYMTSAAKLFMEYAVKHLTKPDAE